MLPKMLSMKIKGIKIFENRLFEMNFVNEQRVYQEEKETGIVTPINGTVNTNNVIALAGVNASGKTNSLLLMNYVFEVIFMGKSANSTKKIMDLMDDRIIITTFFVDKDSIYKTTSELQKNKKGYVNQLEFVNEVILEKKLTSNLSKRKLYEFGEEELSLKLERKHLDKKILQFLKSDDSIVPSQLSKVPSDYVSDTFNQTDMNFLSNVSEFSSEIILFLDPTIEKLVLKVPKDFNKENFSIERIAFDLKLADQEETVVSFFDLNQYLSSGTIRGLGLINTIISTLTQGGYLLIDELENHFNKAIVENIIEFFQSDVNKNGATIIFSTHYSELLDSLKRRDSIRIVRKINNKISVKSLNRLASEGGKNRSDIKNSDLFLSGLFGTAPSFERYWNLNRFIKKTVEGLDND